MKKVQEKLADNMMNGKAFKIAHAVLAVFFLLVCVYYYIA